ncbi:MAG: N-acetylmuramoyl-L-alanine amidase [Clostridia bacterium]|nr:N-acetylmuramoyl-L-alanine amidase [Clostridia bacterium]
MKISIRPAPHSKGCAVDGRSSCDLYQNHQEKCATKCTESMCCEMKHCWQIGEALEKELVARGYQVKMADKKYRKGWPSSKATQNTKDAMAELLAWAPDLHIAIHTNAAGASVRGIRIGYPNIANNAGETVRVAESKRLAELVVKTNKAIYPAPEKVVTTTYNYYELNKPDCPAIYIEAAFANTNKQDAEWVHGNIERIATAYADAIDQWSGKTAATKEEEVETVSYQAYVKTKTGGGASIWSDNKKTSRVLLVKDGEIVTVIGNADSKGFAPVEKDGKRGVFDSQYLVRLEAEPEETPGEPAADDALLDALYAARDAINTAINMAGGA